jgi:pyruvate/2-oxoglutarate dehydrogenase complex dihydrolipoamide acyltransferase (E2) component
LPVEKVKFSTSIDDQLPSVRYLTGLYNVDLNKIVATGPKGITKGDILEHVKIRGPVENVDQPVVDAPAQIIEQKSESVATVQESNTESSLESATPPSNGTYNDIEITSMRNIIANRLTQSKTTIPHQYTKITCELTSINSLRKDLKDKNVKVSLNDFIIKAVATATEMSTVSETFDDLLSAETILLIEVFLFNAMATAFMIKSFKLTLTFLSFKSFLSEFMDVNSQVIFVY